MGGKVGIFSGIFGKKDKPRKDFSNVRSGSSSTDPTPSARAPEPSAPAPAATRTYVVVSGDNLSRIAKQQYGDANEWRTIYEANRSAIKNPDLIYHGQVLRIPEA